MIAIPALVGGVQAVSSLIPNNDDPRRIRQNATWAAAARAGDVDALNALRGMTGDFGTVMAGKYGPAAGWATQVARDDARRQLSAVMGGTMLTPGVQSAQSTSPLSQELAELRAKVSAIASGAVTDAREAAGDTLQRIGSGATTRLSDALDGQSDRITIPTTRGQLVLVAAGVLVLVLMLRQLRRS